MPPPFGAFRQTLKIQQGLDVKQHEFELEG
jgi:hypothetical protein